MAGLGRCTVLSGWFIDILEISCMSSINIEKMTRFFQTTVGANQTSTDCYGDIWRPRDVDCHFRHFLGF